MAHSEHSANAQMAQAARERREARDRLAPQGRAPQRASDDTVRMEILRRLGAP